MIHTGTFLREKKKKLNAVIEQDERKVKKKERKEIESALSRMQYL